LETYFLLFEKESLFKTHLKCNFFFLFSQFSFQNLQNLGSQRRFKIEINNLVKKKIKKCFLRISLALSGKGIKAFEKELHFQLYRD
jgi:hypothetical protein